MTTDWRRFEELVARVEEALVPKGAVVTSPDRIRDLVTGRLREVDASIRLDVGTTPVLITIECRKRQGVQDDTWIEQLATKRAKIGAAKTIAVSATGFSESARKTAQLHGIELRTMEDRIEEEIVQQFLSGFRISIIVTEYTTETIAFELQGGEPLTPDQFADELARSLEQDGQSAVIATEVATGRVLSVDGILRQADDRDLPEDGTPVRKHAVVTFAPNAFQIATREGDRFLSKIAIVATFARRIVPAPATGLHEYATTERPIRRTIEAVAAISQDEGIRVLVDIDSPALSRERGRPAKPPETPS